MATSTKTFEEAQSWGTLRYGPVPEDIKHRPHWFNGIEPELLVEAKLGYYENGLVKVTFMSVMSPDYILFKRLSDAYERLSSKRRI